MKTLKEYMECQGCLHEIEECYQYQKDGFDAGLEFDENEKHVLFFVIDSKTNKFIVY